MELTEKQLDLLSRRNLVILATSDFELMPRAIFVEVNKAEKDKIIITDNQMETTKKNILSNKNVFLLAHEDDYHYGLKVIGRAEYFSEGEQFDFVQKLETNKNWSPKGAIVVTIDNVIEFN